MCGIIALLLADTESHCCQSLYDGLTVLQHRGQDAAGIVTANTRARSIKFQQHKGLGMVNAVFQPEHMIKLQGNVGIGHCRYPTAGSSSNEEAQPMYTSYPCGLALAHNGNLTNTEQEKHKLLQSRHHLNTESDSEVLLNVFAEELRVRLKHKNPDETFAEFNKRATIHPDQIFDAVQATMARCRGGYAVVILIHDVGVVGFRDPWGIRPLVFGESASKTIQGGVDYCIASESVAIDTLGFKLTRDVRPGECILAIPMDPQAPREDKGLLTKQLSGNGTYENASPCIFEYVYFARPDSLMDGVSVYEARLKMGEKLALKIKEIYPDHDIDLVIPVPDTSRTCALQCAETLGVPYREGFIKNRYIARTFIMPGQEIRKKSVRLKLNTIKAEFKDKCVVLVDDSIVRGTTSTELVAMARDAGAKRVYMVSAAPEVRYPNVYGIDLPSSEELIANGRDRFEIAKRLNADWVLYQTLDDLEDSVRCLNPELKTFESSTFCGKYVTGDVGENYLDNLSNERNDAEKMRRNTST